MIVVVAVVMISGNGVENGTEWWLMVTGDLCGNPPRQ